MAGPGAVGVWLYTRCELLQIHLSAMLAKWGRTVCYTSYLECFQAHVRPCGGGNRSGVCECGCLHVLHAECSLEIKVETGHNDPNRWRECNPA